MSEWLKVSSSNSKMFIEIVNQIRTIINEDGLKDGDKIPSERELAERLNVGRSSVREALRSLELLGLIETRRGEGTFLKDFKDHQLIHVLGTFILQGEKTKDDLIETKYLLEKSCIELICYKNYGSSLEIALEDDRNIEDMSETIFRAIVEATGNRLMYRIWLVINEHIKVLRKSKSNIYRKEDYDELMNGILEQNVSKATHALKKIYLDNLSNV